MSHTPVRLRALAALGLSTILFGVLVPTAAAASGEAVASLGSPATITALLPAPDLLEAAPSPADTARIRLAPVAPAPAPPATVAASTVVIALARTHLGARYQYGATGPHAFDCSGLVYRVFEDAGLGRRIDGLESAAALYAHFRSLHRTSTRDPQPGDLVIFGGGSHVGIYIGGGKVIHAMISGVAITRVGAVYPSFTTYIHLGLTALRLPASLARAILAAHPR